MKEIKYDELVGDLNVVLKQILQTPYPYSPGFNNSSPQRVRGSAIKASSSSSLFQQSEFIYNTSENAIELYMPDYWRYIDEGRRPGKNPPIKPLLDWAKLKGLPEGVAWGAQKNIGKFGIAPTNFFDGLVNGVEEYLERELPDRVEELLEQIIENILIKIK